MSAVLAIALILLASVMISSLAAAVMRRLGVAPTDDSARSHGFGDVLRKIDQWKDSRRPR